MDFINNYLLRGKSTNHNKSPQAKQILDQYCYYWLYIDYIWATPECLQFENITSIFTGNIYFFHCKYFQCEKNISAIFVLYCKYFQRKDHIYSTSDFYGKYLR